VPAKNALFAAFVPARVCSATVKSVDASAALAMPGVVDFIDAADLGPAANVTQDIMVHQEGAADPGRQVFAGEKVQFWGQPVGVLLADSRAQAEAAIFAVKVEYADVAAKPVVDIETAIAVGGDFLTKKSPTVRGDAASVLKTCAFTGKGMVNSKGQYHFHMETQTVVAAPTNIDGLRVHCATQAPSSIQSGIASALGIPMNKVVVETVRVGGAFGGKSSNAVPASVAVGFAAHKHRRECRMQMSLQENMATGGKRCPFRLEYTVGCDRDGKILAVTGDSYCENWRPPTDFQRSYLIPNWSMNGWVANTMTPQNTYMRAPTALGETLFIETIVDHIALLAGKTPEAVRALNLNPTPPDLAVPPAFPAPGLQLAAAAGAGGPVPVGVPEDPAAMFAAIQTASGLAALQAAAEEFNKGNLWRKRGVAAIPTEYACGWGGNCHHGAKVDVYPDGTILCYVTGIELGQGLYTKCAQVAAMVLGLPDTSLIEIQCTSTGATPNGGGTYGSMASGANAWGMELACKALKAKLDPVARMLETAGGPPPAWMKLVTAAMSAGVDLSVKSWDTGLAVSGNGYGACAAEVELDVLTGEVEILRADLLYDCGQSLSPEIDIGQVEGAFVVGLGHFLMEGLEYDKATGALITLDTWEYKPPQSMDIPEVWSTTLLKNVKNPTGLHGSKAVGEPPLIMSAAVFCALKQCVVASRKDAGQDGWFQLDAPATPEAVRPLLPTVEQLLKLGKI
jgi:xanthine dehydrogenase/oxidase